MPVVLSLVFCLSASPTQCQTVRPVLEETIPGPPGCAIRGQELGAEWVNEHPKWFLSVVRCTIGGAPKEDV